MSPLKVNSLGLDLDYSVPGSTDEFDQLAKRSGACLAEANNNVLYRSVLAEFRDTFLHGNEDGSVEGVDKQTGIERKYRVTKPETRNDKNEITQEEVTAWDESEKVYFDRVLATLVQQGTYPSVDAARASFQGHAQAVINTVVFDPSQRERAAKGPKKTPKSYVEIAEALVTLKGSVAAAIAGFNAKTGASLAVSGNDEADKAVLATAIWNDQKAKKANIAAGYAG